MRQSFALLVVVVVAAVLFLSSSSSFASSSSSSSSFSPDRPSSFANPFFLTPDRLASCTAENGTSPSCLPLGASCVPGDSSSSSSKCAVPMYCVNKTCVLDNIGDACTKDAECFPDAAQI